MDPDAAFKNLTDAMSERDRPAIAEAADALIGWIERGGFTPGEALWQLAPWKTRQQWLRWLRDLRAVAEM